MMNRNVFTFILCQRFGLGIRRKDWECCCARRTCVQQCLTAEISIKSCLYCY